MLMVHKGGGKQLFTPDRLTGQRKAKQKRTSRCVVYNEGQMTTLSDADIGAEIQAQRLIHNADPTRLRGACYELRMGNVYYDLTEDGKRIALTPGQMVLIKPGHRVVLITSEELDVPNDVLVRVISKGSLFSVGLSPVATYADPGFAGNLGVVTQNISDKYIELPQGEPIAKAEFTRLASSVVHPYQGQHGFQAGIWPIKSHLQKEHHEVATDPRVRSEKEEAFALLPVETRTVIRRIEATQLWTNIGLAVAIVINSIMLFLIGHQLMDNIYGIVGNLVASAIIGLATVTATLLRKNG
jgi:dCTP deaminase